MPAGAALLHVELDHPVGQLAVAQLPAEAVARVLAGRGADQRVEHALLGVELGLGRDLLAQALAGELERDLDQVADDALDVAADIADLGELGGLDLEERRLGEPGEPAGDLGLAAAGGADHQDVLGQHLVAQRVVELLAAPAVAQGDGDGALGLALADDEAVELGDDLAGGECAHRRSRISSVTFSLV